MVPTISKRRRLPASTPVPCVRATAKRVSGERGHIGRGALQDLVGSPGLPGAEFPLAALREPQQDQVSRRHVPALCLTPGCVLSDVVARLSIESVEPGRAACRDHVCAQPAFQSQAIEGATPVARRHARGAGSKPITGPSTGAARRVRRPSGVAIASWSLPQRLVLGAPRDGRSAYRRPTSREPSRRLALNFRLPRRAHTAEVASDREDLRGPALLSRARQRLPRCCRRLTRNPPRRKPRAGCSFLSG